MAADVEVVQRIYDSFSTGDIPAVLAVMSDGMVWEEPASMPFENQVGPDAIAANVFAVLPTLFDGFAVEPSEIVAGDGIVTSVGVYRGVGKTTGKTLAAEFVHIWRVDDGKASYFRTYTDTYQWRDVLGTL